MVSIDYKAMHKCIVSFQKFGSYMRQQTLFKICKNNSNKTSIKLTT